MDRQTKHYLRGLGTLAIMLVLAGVVVLLVAGCKEITPPGFEDACKSRGGHVVTREKDRGHTVIVQCRDKRTGKVIPL